MRLLQLSSLSAVGICALTCAAMAAATQVNIADPTATNRAAHVEASTTPSVVSTAFAVSQ